jgi:hypothetical protein
MKTLLLFLLSAALVCAATSDQEIETLLGKLGRLDGAVFIRNGSEHSATDAEAHLRMKWGKLKDRVRTAEDFITLCATKSSMSGQRYEIRLKDGSRIFADDYLRAELQQLRVPKTR